VALVKGRGHDNVSTLPATLVRHGVGRTVRAGLFLVFTASLLLFFVVTGRPVYGHVEYAGALAQIAALSDHVRAEDIVLVRGGGATDVAVRDTSELVAPPLTYVYGRNALPVKGRWPGKYAAAFADQVTLWRDEGRRVYLLLAASGGDMLFPGYALRSVDTWTLRLREFQQLKDQKPKQSYLNEVPFHLYELVPASGAARSSAIGYNDTAAQVAGFYPSEAPAGEELRAAWTDGLAVLRLPASAQGHPVTLRVAGGRRPKAIRAARLCVDVAAEPIPYPEGGVATTLPWQEVRCTSLAEQTSDVAVALPVLQPNSEVLVRLRSEPWVPAKVTPAQGTPRSPDMRSLGIRFVGATFAP
jgi:hypothetical protein